MSYEEIEIKTESDIATARDMGFAIDQCHELTIGAKLWTISGDGWNGSMGRWPCGRGAFMAGGDSLWGDWHDDRLRLDETDQDGSIIYVDVYGNETAE